MSSEYVGVFKYLYDWQSFIAGLFALIAGVVAYAAGLRQARAVEQQNRELKIAERRRLAREQIVAIRLLNGALATIESGLTHVEGFLEQPRYLPGSAIVPEGWRELVRKPPLDVVWPHLGVCGFEVVDNYVLLDAEIETFLRSSIHSAGLIKNKIAAFHSTTKFLRDELDEAAKKCIALLADN